VLADAVNAETGVRGYAATRDPLFLAPYNLTLTRIDAERRSLRTAAAVDGYRRQQQTMDATTGRVLAQLAQLRLAISAVSPPGTSVRRWSSRKSPWTGCAAKSPGLRPRQRPWSSVSTTRSPRCRPGFSGSTSPH
jgi:hypothetical protein